jgi:hypothetical protein
LSHFDFGQFELMVESLPELGLEWLGGQLVDMEFEANSVKDSLGCLETIVLLEVWSSSLLSEDILGD